ncbi:MAG: septum formation initiator family protein [Lachnospiraceae bacterium]|nr:septum formation initiator family protein [Lachnospiraceae bacterium]
MSKRVIRGKKKRSNTGRASIICIALFLLLVMSVQMVRLYQKDQQYVQQIEALNSQVKEQEEKKAQLSEYEGYINTPEYIESTAQDKLGLVHQNEIIFREKK